MHQVGQLPRNKHVSTHWNESQCTNHFNLHLLYIYSN